MSRLSRRLGALRAARFGAAAAAGFLVAEAVIVLGVHLVFGNQNPPSSASSSPALLVLDVSALVLGVAVSFILNERVTVRGSGDAEERTGNALVRLLKFEGVSGAGNAITIGVQLTLLAAFGLSPAVGNVIGAITSFPVSYLVSMRLVWNT